MKTVVTRYKDEPESRSELFDFYRQEYPGAPWLLDSDRFEWQSLQNPLLENGETEIWLLRDEDNNIVGQNIYILYGLSVDGANHRGYCSTNLIVSSGLVGKGFGHALIEVNENRGGLAYAVGITPASTRAFIKRGWVLIEDARLHTLVVKPGPVLRYVGISGVKALLLAPALWVAAAAARLGSLITARRHLNGVGHRRIDRFEPEYDDRWREFLRQSAIHFERTSTQLNYKYASRSDVSHTILLFEQSGSPVGYGVFRLSENKERGIRLGRIVDMVYDPALGQPLANHMINVMKRSLLKLGVHGLVGISANGETRTAYKKNGFVFSRPQHAIMREDGFEIRKLRESYDNLWYITLGDSDLDNYW